MPRLARTPRVRVLHCVWRLGLGGAERQLIGLSAAMAAQGADVHVLTVHPGACDEHLARTSARTHRLRGFTKYDLTVIPRLVAFLRELRPDVVTTWLTQMDLIGGFAAHVTGTPFVLCERSGADAYPSSVLHSLRTLVAKRAAAIVANSEGGQEYWRRFIPESRICVIPNMVPFAEIERARAVDAVHDSDEVILYVGRFGHEKNVFRLLEALSLVLPQRRARAVFCGDGPLRRELEQQAERFGIADRTTFLGAVSATKVWEWMKRADLVVAVSLFEGNPNIVLEAIACGTPLVVSNITGYASVVDDGTAFLVDPFSPEAIANGVLAVLNNPAEAAQRSTRARRALEGRAEEDVAAQYLDVFERVSRREK